MTNNFKFQCQYCRAQFKSEKNYIKHYCKDMKREDDFKSSRGQAALIHYKYWMKIRHHAIIPNPTTFKTSKFFTAFFNFVKFASGANVPDMESYIDLMVKNKIGPVFWCRDEAYVKYTEYINTAIPIKKTMEITIKTLFDVSDACEVDVSDVFTVLIPSDIIQYLRQRKLSPWLLLNSRKFVEFYMKNTTPEERTILQDLITPEYWKHRFEQRKDDYNYVITCIKELGL